MFSTNCCLFETRRTQSPPCTFWVYKRGLYASSNMLIPLFRMLFNCRMSFEDFCKHFTNITGCRLVNTSVFSFHKTWHEGAHKNQWIVGQNAGGCINSKQTFLTNPQVSYTLFEICNHWHTSWCKFRKDCRTFSCILVNVLYFLY